MLIQLQNEPKLSLTWFAATISPLPPPTHTPIQVMIQRTQLTELFEKTYSLSNPVFKLKYIYIYINKYLSSTEDTVKISKNSWDNCDRYSPTSHLPLTLRTFAHIQTVRHFVTRLAIQRSCRRQRESPNKMTQTHRLRQLSDRTPLRSGPHVENVIPRLFRRPGHQPHIIAS